MKKLIFIFLLCLTAGQAFAERASSEELVRRLYLDLLNRRPSVEEYKIAKEALDKGKYEAVVNFLMKEDEYFSNLASKVVTHYAPEPKKRSHNFVTYKRLEKHLKDKYLGKTHDFRDFVEDMMQAKGIAFANQMVLFYSAEEDSAEMAARFSARVLGVPMLCARCHDHKIHPDIKIDHFWSLAAFFEGMDKKIINTREQLKETEKLFTNKYKSRREIGKEEYDSIQQWIKSEKEGLSVYASLTAEESMGRDMSNTLNEMEKKNNNMEEQIALKAPMLFIYEKSRSLGKLKIEYEIDGKKFTSRASHFKRDRKLNDKDLPRDILTKWMARREPLYMARAITNWTTNWLYGRGWIMPAYDTYKAEGPQAVTMNKHAQALLSSKFNLHKLVKNLLMAPVYREKSLMSNDEEKFVAFAARRLRHLSGEQLVNSLNSTHKEIKAQYNSEEALARVYRLEVYKKNLVEKIFPVSLDDTEASYRGTLNQSLHLSTNQIFLNYTKRFAESAYKRHKNKGIEEFLSYVFNKLYTREPNKNEIDFFKAKIDFAKVYSESGIFETVWTLMNSPEMRLY